jgi:hypothetical protein
MSTSSADRKPDTVFSADLGPKLEGAPLRATSPAVPC